MMHDLFILVLGMFIGSGFTLLSYEMFKMPDEPMISQPSVQSEAITEPEISSNHKIDPPQMQQPPYQEPLSERLDFLWKVKNEEIEALKQRIIALEDHNLKITEMIIQSKPQPQTAPNIPKKERESKRNVKQSSLFAEEEPTGKS